MKITFEPPNQPDVIELIAELDAYQDGLYPPEARYVLDMPALLKPNVLFVVARDDENMAIGCAAIILESEYGELKRMYVRPKTRGQGVAHQLLKELEINAIAHGCPELLLETGLRSQKSYLFMRNMGFSVENHLEIIQNIL